VTNANNKKQRPLHSVASDYFEYLGTHLPQQCASDDFYFLPRSEVATQHLSSLDDLNPEKIQDHIRYVQNLFRDIPAHGREDLDEETDRFLLKQSMESFVRQFDDAQVWRNDPTLYVKIPLFATDHVISRRDSSPDESKSDLCLVLGQIPSFLGVASRTLYCPSELALEVAVSMVQDAIGFYKHDLRSFFVQQFGSDKELLSKNEEALQALQQYKKELCELPSTPSFAVGGDGLQEISAVSLRYHRSPEEILEIAQHMYQKTQGKLRELARRIDPRKTWGRLIREQAPSATSSEGLMRLYQREVEHLRRFFYSQRVVTIPPEEKVIVLKTPSYLRSLRATASYRAPLSGGTNSHGLFYITPGKEDLEVISKHCPYLCAHETYPGHHILDHLRINQSNPIRRQIESPLFYEGWSCYAEQLLDELGYIEDPRVQLIGLKRQLWRNLRAILDVELQTERITLAQGAEKIERIGFSAKRAQSQIRRFALTPGYQLCYSMGMYEILRLRKRFSSQLALKIFHDMLLGGGQLPFHLVEKRLEANAAGREKE